MSTAPRQAQSRYQRAFTLLEMAVVLTIVGLLLSGLIGGMGTLQARQREAQTQAQMDEIREALISFAAVNRRLPCPAAPATASTVAGAGLERAATAAGCTGGAFGVVPWATLGLPQADAWGRRFSYAVSPLYSRLAPAILLTSTGTNMVSNRAGVVIAVQVPAVVVSHGVNARGSRNTAGALAAASTDASEQENADSDVDFIADTPNDEFDDLVVWVPSSVLMSRMLQAGTLP